MSHKPKMPHLFFGHNLMVLMGRHVRLDGIMCEEKLTLAHPAEENVTSVLKTIPLFSFSGLDY